MIPYKDENPSYSFPVITLLIIMANIVVYLLTITEGAEAFKRIVFEWGFVPASFTSDKVEVPQPEKWLTPFTNLFLHADIFHLGFNMLFLWLFGDNVEDRLGSFRFLFFYIFAGLFAGFVHFMLNTGSTLPAIGASGAIAGVMGAYMVLYPRARIRTLIILFPFIRVVLLPASFFLILWFAMQILSQVFNWGIESGVAFGAHIGGFIIGMVLLSVLKVDDKIIHGPGDLRAPGHWGW